MARSSTSWRSGQSGNPSGRRKEVAEVREAALKYSVEAIEKLVEIMRNEKNPPTAQAAACREILDRGLGKPAQEIIQESTVMNVDAAAEKPDISAILAKLKRDEAAKANDAEGSHRVNSSYQSLPSVPSFHS